LPSTGGLTAQDGWLGLLNTKSAFIKLADDSTVNIIVASVTYCLSA